MANNNCIACAMRLRSGLMADAMDLERPWQSHMANNNRIAFAMRLRSGLMADAMDFKRPWQSHMANNNRIACAMRLLYHHPTELTTILPLRL